MPDLTALYAESAAVSRRILTATAQQLLDDVINTMGAYDIRPRTIRIDIDAEDDGSRWPFGWLVVIAPDNDAVDVTFAVDETMDQLNDWPHYTCLLYTSPSPRDS